MGSQQLRNALNEIVEAVNELRNFPVYPATEFLNLTPNSPLRTQGPDLDLERLLSVERAIERLNDSFSQPYSLENNSLEFQQQVTNALHEITQMVNDLQNLPVQHVPGSFNVAPHSPSRLEQAIHQLNVSLSQTFSPNPTNLQYEQHGGSLVENVEHIPSGSLNHASQNPSSNQPHQPSLIAPNLPTLDRADQPCTSHGERAVNSSEHTQQTQREREGFNVTEIRRPFNVIASRAGDAPNPAEFYTQVYHILTELAESAARLASRSDIIQLELSGEGFSHHAVVQVNDERDSILPAFLEFLEELTQSNAELPDPNNLEMIVQVVRNPHGGVKRKAEKTLDCELIRKKRQHLYIVANRSDQLCFSISLAHLCNPAFTDAQAVQQAVLWQRTAGLTEQTPVTFSDVQKFEKIVNRKIVVFYKDGKDAMLRKFQTDFPDRSNPLFLLLFKNHYYGIKSLTAFTGSKYICSYCFSGFLNINRHNCEGRCSVCLDPKCTLQRYNSVQCADCNRICRNSFCLDKHKQPTLRPNLGKHVSNCETTKYCPVCKRLYDLSAGKESKPHECSIKCTICRQKVPSGVDVTLNEHQCYIQPTLTDPELGNKLFFYDFETFTDQTGRHIPFLVYTKTLAGEVWYSYGLNCVRDFLLHFRNPRYRGFTFLAHNSRGFDSYLVLSVMVELGIKPHLITQGSKVLCFTEPDYALKFTDSLSFLTMKLSQMPKALGFNEHCKGFFPHLFSSEKTLNYVGPLPPPCFYGVDRMNPAEQDRFYIWYNEACKHPFDFQKEALYYCQNDVEILFKACVKFREEFFKETTVDPLKSITIASACMKVFTSNFLPPNTLAIPSPVDYRRQCKTFSNASIQWLEWVAQERGIFIQHALNKGEKKIGPYHIDGYAEVRGVKIAFEFNGCFFHGCPTCFPPDQICPLRRVCFETFHSATMERARLLQSVYGVQLEVIWEHDWILMKDSHPGLKRFLQSFNAPEPLSPRNALYGGRTCALRLRYTAGEEESVHYVDFTSLYPYVNANCPYPLGHPKIIYKDFDDPRSYFGFIRATVFPPRGLFFPVLPYKTSTGKLVFTLCRACAEMNYQAGPCNHTDRERALTGVWVTLEFNKALELGYTVAEISEVWHFENQSSSIFKPYIDTFLKGKQEASGFPAEATDEESRLKYVADYKLNQGIQLDVEKIEVNPAKRQVAKLCLNSFWGKFAQRNDLAQTTIVTDSAEFFNFLFSGKYTVSYFHFLNDDMCMIQWKYNKRCISPPNKVNNVFIAAFTTAHARLKLFTCLEPLQERVLYIDTDSLIYVVKPGQTSLELGNYLGDLTDELGGDTIQQFVSTGPKSYAYQTRNQKKVVMRCKGITQTQECSERVNFDSVKELVESYLQGSTGGVLEAPQHTIRRDKRNFQLKNTTFQKKFRLVYDKRRLFPDGTTLPFGY
ncbi:uncharacterized protein LOC118556952 [Fundulus heteroclitus]|uniref:uncharacterized protein LOC118556952 n=1 Tax=Fundulus heteroclitus TaxID=8078 RepID=UPI00165C4467|nr:uncharacterized protein LOC118556952 [Fundulus heteroclitus]XP_035981581.1 uncharacterized protein LOC118556952 [Fundulus heteroclitus]